MTENGSSEAKCAVGILLDLQTPEKKPPQVVPSTYTKQEKTGEDHNDHESSFSLTVTDPPVSSSQMKRSILEGINDSIEESREGTAAAEACITPGEIPLTEEIKLLDDEQFDFDIPFSPVPNKKTSLESSTCDQPSGDDDEIFFGPMGHTEKCVSKAVEDVVKEETMFRPLSPLNPQQIVHLFKEAQRVAFHISASAPKVSDSSDRTESTSSLRPQALNFSNISVNDSVLIGTTDNSVHISPPKLKSPRQRKNTFTKEDSALENLSETLNKALPEVEPVPRDENGKIQFSAHGQKKVGEVKSSGFARGGTIRRSLPTSVGRGLKPVGNKSSGGLKPPNQTFLRRPSVGKCEKRLRKDSVESMDDAMSVCSNDSEASYCALPSGKRTLPQPKLKPSLSGLKPPGQSRIVRPVKQHNRSNTVHTPGSTTRPKVESRINTKPTPTRRSLGSQPIGSKLSLPASRLSTGSGLQKAGPANKPSVAPATSRISTTRSVTTKNQATAKSVKSQPQTVVSKLGTNSGRPAGKSPVYPTVSKPSGLMKPAIKGTMTKLDNLKPGAVQRKTVPGGSKLCAAGTGPMKATGLSRPGSKPTPRSTPKEVTSKKSAFGRKTPDCPVPKPSSNTITKDKTPNHPPPKPSSNTITKSSSGSGGLVSPILTTPVKVEKNVQPKRLTLQDTTNTPRKSSGSSVSSFGTPISSAKKRSFLPTPNKSLSISTTESDGGKGLEETTGNVGSQYTEPSPAIGVLVDIGIGTIPDTPTAFKAKPKVLNTPQANKENQPKSIWSPVRKPRMALEDEVIQCTKRFSVYQKKE